MKHFYNVNDVKKIKFFIILKIMIKIKNKSI